jgi:DNA (cytosine-5)-methyltransferase 1
LDLFSGIGGFALAARMVGQIETVAFCEREAYAQRVLKKHWPHLPICDDIHNLKGNDYGPIDLITGGFPCQPYSLAGKRGGNDDDRALWPQMLRVIREARPTWIIGENVPGIISMALDGVLADLEREGYACETFAIPACAVDAKHRRNRIWIVAHGGSERRQQDARGSHENETADEGRISQHNHEPASHGESSRSRTLADAQGGERGLQLSARNQEEGAESHGGSEDVANSRRIDGHRWPHKCDTSHGQEALGSKADHHNQRCGGMGWGDESQWLTEPDVGRVAHGIPSRVDRLKGLGNAIVPQVAAALLSKIVEVHYGTVARHNTQLGN